MGAVCCTSCGLLVSCYWDTYRSNNVDRPYSCLPVLPPNCTNMSSQYVLVHQMVAVNVTEAVQRQLGAAGCG